MAETIMTRGGQITISKEFRKRLNVEEGDIVTVNTIGEIMLVSKKDSNVLDKSGFLPENFDKLLKKIRSSPEERLKRFGIIE